MVFTLAVIVAALGVFQMGGAIEKIINHKRELEIFDRAIPAGVNRHDLSVCATAINDQKAAGGSVKISDIDETSKYSVDTSVERRALLIFPAAILVESVPPTCMVLATVISGTAAQEGGPVTIPMGTDSLQYTGMRPEDHEALAKALGN